MAKIFSGKVYSVSEFPSVGLLKGAFYFNTTTGMCKVAVSETELKELNISDAYVQIAGETPVTLAAWIQNIGQDFNGLEQTVDSKVAIANIHTATDEVAATADTLVASKLYVDQEVTKAVAGGVDGLASQTWVTEQINPVSEKVTALETKTANITVAEGATSVDGVAVKSAIESKVDQSAYNTKIGELTDLINSKEGQVIVTADKALISDAEGKIAASAVSSTELGYLAGVTSNVQEQINAANAAVVTAKGEAIAAAKTETETQIAALGIADYAKTADVEQAIASSAETLQGNIDKKVDQSAYGTKVKALEDAIAAIHTFSVSVVDTLPETGADKVIYLVPEKEGAESKAEYLWIDGKWELIGTTHVSLEGYATEDYADSAASAAQAAAVATAAGALAEAKQELQGNIDAKVATETYKAKVEEIEGSIDSIINGSSVESQTVSTGTWKFVSADRSSAVVYEVTDAAASNVYVEVLRGTDFVTISGTTVTATAGGAFFVYYLG